ncbi:MAG TPA: DUF2157 domain-containing protein, partial [Flavobacterium sp.]|nr:DUF2157 domain-containing protein [Flavobacterium sp.]
TPQHKNSMQKQHLNELLEHGIITPEVATAITNYYQNKQTTASKLPIIFGIFGALLGGLGIILLIGHNWDEFTTTTQVVLAFLPLLLAQIASGYTILKKPESIAWRESSGAFLFCGIGASIALIAQIYHLPGNFNRFVLTWMLLALPLIYLLKSSVVSLLFLIGITVYNMTIGYIDYPNVQNYKYWLLLLAVAPHYYQLIKQKPNGNFTTIHHWFIALTLLINLESLDKNNNELIFITYGFLIALFYLLGKTAYFRHHHTIANSYLTIGKLGGLTLLYMASFRFIWKPLLLKNLAPEPLLLTVTLTLFVGCALLLYQLNKRKAATPFTLFHFNFIALAVFFITAQVSIIATVILSNLYILSLGLQEIQKGNKTHSIARLNFGILIIAILTGCRFFDENMTFIVRGVMFIIVGFGFFALNYFLLKKRKQHEN